MYRRNKKHQYRVNGNEFYMILMVATVLCYVLKVSRWKLILTLEVIIAIAFALKDSIKKKIRNKNLINSKIHEIDCMDGVMFEYLLQAHFEKLGYKVKTTPKSNDYGADLILIKDGIRTVVQAKRYKGKVGVAAIQQAYASMGYYKASRCMVITNSYYTSQARTLAKKNDVILWDRETLIRKFKIKEK